MAATRDSGRNLTVYLAALMLIGLMLGPVIYIIVGGFRTNSQITVDPAGLPDPWVFGNYTDILASENFWRQVGNSTIVAVVTTVAVVGLGVMASYVLARYKFRGSGAMYALFAAGLMFPATVAITPSATTPIVVATATIVELPTCRQKV
jgi:raffinose/stachyose/melibiose transport system permease protein